MLLALSLLGSATADIFPASFRAHYRPSMLTDRPPKQLFKELREALPEKRSLVKGMYYCHEGDDDAVTVYAKLESCGFDYDSSTVGLVTKDGTSIFPVLPDLPHTTAQLALNIYDNLGGDCIQVKPASPYVTCVDDHKISPVNIDGQGIRPDDAVADDADSAKSSTSGGFMDDDNSMQIILLLIVAVLLCWFVYSRRKGADAAPTAASASGDADATAVQPVSAAAAV